MRNLIFIILLFISNSLIADDFDIDLDKFNLKSPEGQEFWICFMRNHNDPDKVTENTQLHLELFITSDKDANITIEIKALNFKEKIFVPAKTVRNVKLSPAAQIISSEIIEEKMAVHVKSDAPITVYGLNRRRLTTDTFLALPTSVIGNIYRSVCYNISVQLTAQFAIVATEDNTKVTIVPTVATYAGRPANVPFDVTLNKGDVYQVTAKNISNDDLKNDLSGSLVTADKKISFLSGHQCAYVPDNVMACNHLVEQLPPVASWGKHYYIGELKKRSRYNYRVIANEDETKIFANNEFLTTLNAGQFIEKNVNEEVQITANKPILVAQYSQGFRNGDAIGDPMMLLISPTQQFLKKYRFATPVNGFWEHYVNVVVPTSSISSLKLNGKTVPKSVFKQFGKTRYSIAYLRINYGTHLLEADEPFGMSPYGFGYDKDKYDAYGNLGGQSFLEYIEYKDSLAPEVIVNGNEITFRDDRVNDQGLDKIEIISKNNIDFKIPKFEAGVPQLSFKVKSDIPEKFGSVVFNAFDVAGNSQIYTLCWHIDDYTASYQFDINKDDIDCEKSTNIDLQAFGRISQVSNNFEVNNLKNVEQHGEFNSPNSYTGYFGVGVSIPIKARLIFTPRIYINSYNTLFNASDSTTSKLLLDNGTYTDLQESTDLQFDNTNLNLQMNIEYQFNSKVYSFVGLNTGILFSKAVNVNRKINYHTFVTYPETKSKYGTKTEIDLEELNTFNFGINFGFGLNQKITNEIGVFAELEYLYNFTSLLANDNSWNTQFLSFNIGVKYSLK